MANLVAIVQPEDSFSGGPGDDTYTGTPGADTINGNGGNDKLSGGAGGDTINGGDGNDFLASYLPDTNFYYPGQDPHPISLDQYTEHDTLLGGNGNDVIAAGYGDTVDGGDGSDTLYLNLLGASAGVTVDFRPLQTGGYVSIGGGTIKGIEVFSSILGSNFDDNITGYDDTSGFGNSIYGNGGNDRLTASYYTSILDGGTGDDVLDGRTSYYLSKIDGGDGNDTIYVNPNAPPQETRGGAGDDTLYSSGATWGGDGNDTIWLQPTYYTRPVYGENGDDVIHGAANPDLSGNIISGGAGSDTLTGAEYRDILVSGDIGGDYYRPVADNGTEHDHLEGGGGNDYLAIGYGDDADGGTGLNVLQLSLGGASAGVTLDTTNIITGTSYTLGGGTIVNIQSVKEIFGSAFGDTITMDSHDSPATAMYGSPAVLYGGGGDDRLTISGSVDGSLLSGDDGNDTLIGSDGGDRLYGGAGADVMHGAAGSDTFVLTRADEAVTGELIDGGSGTDTLLIDNSNYNISGAIDLSAAAIIDVEALAVTRVAAVAMTATQFNAFKSFSDTENNYYSSTAFILTTSGNVFLNGDTSAITLNITLANGTNVFDMSGLNGGRGSTVTGGSGTDTITGGSGVDILNGGDGNDVLTGGDSPADPIYNRIDQLSGGRGDDHYFLTGTQVNVIENASEGYDTVTAGFSYTLSANVETLYLNGNSDIDGHGNNLDNVIGGNSGANHLYGLDGNDMLDGGAGADTLEGGDGNDRLIGGTGADFLDGGAGIDLADYHTETAGVTVQLGLTDTAIGTATGGDQLRAIENVTGTDFADVLIGGNGDNVLVGGGGDDRLEGGLGNDQLIGGTGADIMVGGVGDDLYRVDQQGDWAFENAGEGTDAVISTASYYLYANVENLALAAGAGNIFGVGNELANTITGNEGDNLLLAHAGDDTVHGGAGADTIYGEDGNDHLFGDAGHDLVVGGAGDDVIDGGTGADDLFGGTGNDVFYVDQQADVVYENAGEGTDTVISTSNLYLYANVENLTLASGAGNIFGVGNELANTITGNEGDNLLLAHAGDDTVHGGAGADTIYGEDGNDHLFGDAGHDLVVGGAGDDVIDGGTGADDLFGGTGNDVFYVDQQADVVYENAGEGTDTVISTSNLYLYANVENLTLASGAGNIFGVGNELANTITGNEGDNLLLAHAGDDTVHGGAGADTIYGEDGNDHLFGDAGHDLVVGGAGDDVIDGGTGADDLFGGTGNDVFYVDQQADVVYENAGEGTDTVISTASYYLYANIENLTLASGAGNIFGVGNELANAITGNESANLIQGGDGNDILNGKAGNDTLYGQAGADTFLFEHGTGVDTVGDFVAGTDKIDLTAIGYSWQQVQNAFHQNGADLAIDLGNGDSVVLHGVTAAQLQQSDFVLAGGSAAVTTLTAHAAAPATSDLQAIDHGAMLSGLWHDGGHGPALMATL